MSGQRIELFTNSCLLLRLYWSLPEFQFRTWRSYVSSQRIAWGDWFGYRTSLVGSQELAKQGHLTWLSNPSFREGLLPAPTPIPDCYVKQLESEEEQTNVSIQSTHTLLVSSCDDEEDKDSDHDKESPRFREDKGVERRKRNREESHRHERKKESKKKKFGKPELSSRRSSKRWVDLDNKDFQFDARGDRDNLVYDSLYRKHVPLFYRHQIKIWSDKRGRSINSDFGFIHLEEDDIVMDEKIRGGRYWSAKVASLEWQKDFRRLKIFVNALKPKAKTHFLLPPGEFISLEDSDAQEELKASCTLQEESWDGYVIRKTKEFNQHTRERPEDESLWIMFANFQDELIKAATKKAAAQQAVEKKIAVLEKALEIHPFSEDLWLLFLDTCRQKDLASALITKWENAIKHIPRSYRLWRGYLHFRLGDFSLFSVSSVRKLYMQSLQTYFAVHNVKRNDCWKKELKMAVQAEEIALLKVQVAEMSAVLVLPQVKDLLKTLAKGKEKGQEQGKEHDVNAHAVTEEREPSKKPWDEDVRELSSPSYSPPTSFSLSSDSSSSSSPEGAIRKSHGETFKRGRSTVREVENPYEELRQPLEGMPPSKRKGHAPHEEPPSKERERSESPIASMEDLASTRRRAQRSPTPPKRKRSPHSSPRCELKREENNSRKKERKGSPSFQSSSLSSSFDESSGHSSFMPLERGPTSSRNPTREERTALSSPIMVSLVPQTKYWPLSNNLILLLEIRPSRSFKLRHDHAEKTKSRNRAEMEKNLVSIFVDLCRFEWQTGHHELAVGLFQAFIEYNLFSPLLDVSERRKRRLFSEFWGSGAPRIGEDGAVGWASWLQEEEEWIQKALGKDQAEAGIDEESEPGGWTGWYEPAKDNKGKEKDEVMSLLDGPIPEDTADLDMQGTDEDENADIKDPQNNEQDEAVLLERLGLSLEAENEVEVKDSGTWKRWSEKEHDRDCIQWLPIRLSNLKDEEILAEAGEEEVELERAVLFDDIQECLFSLTTADAQLDLICHFTDFCSGPYPQWCCSNSSKWIERMEALENLYGPFVKELNRASASCERDLEKFAGGVEWIHESQGRYNFLANALLLLRSFFSNNFLLEEKLLNVENHRYGISTENVGGFGPRILAKRLLKNDRQAILLLGAYACAEASAGNLDVARKVFDTTLASLSSLPVEVQPYGSIVYECYAEMEIRHMAKTTEKELYHQKVLYILSCLGSRIPYTPFRAGFAATATDLLKAKRGFKEQIQSFLNEKKQLDINNQFKSVVVCASMFELLVEGLEAAASTFKESFAMSLPGKQQQSLHFELLHCKYVSMLEEQKQYMKPTVLRRTILQTLAQFPSNPHILGAFIRCSSRTACTNDLRRFFDDALQRNPTTVLWLFAISIELGRPGSGPRIHSLFEKAVDSNKTQQSVVLWRCYMAYELEVRGDFDAARRVYFRAIHACPWSKLLWLDGFKKMSSVLSAKELSDFQDIMREKELRLRTDVYEVLLEEEEK
ncbi:hypothetical protein L7F22_046050 [Adiantum nelumboides]|nr:hypothetical protein [Adiantum nelumboides]